MSTKKAIFIGAIQVGSPTDYIPCGCSANSVICAPIVVNKDIRGIIYLDSTKKNAFKKQDIEFIELLSKEISIAFERSFQSCQSGHLLARDELTGCFDRRQFDTDIVEEGGCFPSRLFLS